MLLGLRDRAATLKETLARLDGQARELLAAGPASKGPFRACGGADDVDEWRSAVLGDAARVEALLEALAPRRWSAAVPAALQWLAICATAIATQLTIDYARTSWSSAKDEL